MKVDDLHLLLERHPFCAGMAPERVAFMSGCASNERYADGQRITVHDTIADAVWLLRAGRVELRVLGKHTVETVEEGELFGWSALLDPHIWHFDAVAVGPVRAIRLDGRCLREKCTRDTAFGFDLAMRILGQAEDRLEKARVQVLDLYGGRK